MTSGDFCRCCILCISCVCWCHAFVMFVQSLTLYGGSFFVSLLSFLPFHCACCEFVSRFLALLAAVRVFPPILLRAFRHVSCLSPVSLVRLFLCLFCVFCASFCVSFFCVVSVHVQYPRSSDGYDPYGQDRPQLTYDVSRKASAHI